MSQNDKIQQWLQNGITAARSGDKAQARRLFEQVLRADEDNELAWIWMASVVNGDRERRMCLERVLRINPHNSRARDAINALVGIGSDASSFDAERVQRGAASTNQEGGWLNRVIGALAGLAAMVVIALALTLLNPPPATVVSATQAPSNTPILYTNTPTLTPTFPGVEVALDDRTLPTLPPTFTPTVTQSPTPTLPPTATPLPPNAFTLIYVARAANAAQGDVIIAAADGTETSIIGADAREAYYSPDGAQVILVRDTAADPDAIGDAPTNPEATADPTAPDSVPPDSAPNGASSAAVSELFIANGGDLAAAQQVTQLLIADGYQPDMSPDGRLIAFTSNYDGNDEELYLLDVTSGIITQLTNNAAVDREPHWSPDGTRLLFTSDRETPGFTELYSYDLLQDIQETDDGQTIEPVTRLTNDSGNSYMGRWSPDGQRIAYINDRTGDGDLYVTTASGTRTLLVIGDDDADDRYPAWSPNGRYIAFISNRNDDRFQVYVTDIDGDTLVRVQNDERNALSVAFRPDARFRN